jgi:hypothetical protein
VTSVAAQSLRPAFKTGNPTINRGNTKAVTRVTLCNRYGGLVGETEGLTKEKVQVDALLAEVAFSDKVDQERIAIAQYDGDVPAIYAEAFASLVARCPAGVPFVRWQEALNDAGLFLDKWGNDASRLGWLPPNINLFGVDKNAPLARYDNMGLCWLLQGRFVTAIDENGATLSNGLKFYHRKPACERRSDLLKSETK